MKINKVLSKIISKIKKEPYEVDEAINFSVMISMIWDKSIMVIRGLWHKIWLKKAKGIIFIGKRVKIRNHKKIQLLGSATI